MNRFYKGYESIAASPEFKSRMVRMMQHEEKESAAKRQGGFVIKKKTLAILIAAAIMVLAIGTAAAVGLTTAGRLKENTEQRLETAEDERYRDARKRAEQIVDDATYSRVIPLTETAAVQDVGITLKSVERDGDELLLTFAADSEKTGMILQLADGFPETDVRTQRILNAYDTFCEIGMDARAFRLTFGGRDFTPYYTNDFPVAAGYGDHDDYVIRFFDMPEIPYGTEMTLSGTLFRCDAAGVRQGEIGAFSIPFVFDYTDAVREADIERETQEILNMERTRDEKQQVNLEHLAEEAATLGQTVGFTQFHDVSADEQGIVLGLTDMFSGEDGMERFRYFCMNGYRVVEQELACEWDDGFGQRTIVMRLPYYAQRQYLDSVLTIACVELSGQSTKTEDGWLMPSEYKQDVFIFRYDLGTGKVTLPKNDAERDAWFKPIPINTGNRALDIIPLGAYVMDVKTEKQEQNGVEVCIRRAAFNDDGTLEIFYQAENMACEVITWETFPEEVRINGETAPRYTFEAWDAEWKPFRLTDERIAEMLDAYSMEKTRWIIDSLKVVPAKRFDMYDGPITIEVKNWTLYDLNKQGERELVGTFSFTFTVDPANAYRLSVNPREGLRLDR